MDHGTGPGERQRLRLSGLLHDIGHAPFSHVGENQLFARGLRHEDYTTAIIRGTEIAGIIDRSVGDRGVTAEAVCNIIEATPPRAGGPWPGNRGLSAG